MNLLNSSLTCKERRHPLQFGSMDLEERIRQAARAAIIEVGIDGVEYDTLYRHPDSDRVEVHFREGTRYFGVQILLGAHPEHSANTSVEVLTDQISTALRNRAS